MKKQLAGGLAALMLLTACGGGSSSKSEVNYDGVPFDTNVFKDYFIVGQDFETLNYLNSGAAINTRVFNQGISGLVDTDEYGNIVLDLAAKEEHNDDYTVWTYTLRDDVTWSTVEGEVYAPVVAQDWVTALEAELTPENASVCTEMAVNHLVGAAEFNKGEITDFSQVGVKALDEKTVEFTLKMPAPWFNTVLLYSSFYPLNADFFAEHPWTSEDGTAFGSTNENILYNGAYLLTDVQKDAEKTFKANPNYWDAENVKIPEIYIIAVKDAESTKEYFERGELTYCTLMGTQPTAESRKENPYMFRTEPIACSYVWYFNNLNDDPNTQKAMLSENFRKGIMYGFDRYDYVAMTDPLAPETLYSWAFTAPGFVHTSDGTDYCDLPALKPYQNIEVDTDLAVEYFEAAKNDGVEYPVNLPYWIKAGNETAAQTAETFKNILETTFPDYITVEIEEYTNSASAEVYAFNYQAMAAGGWVPDYGDPSNVVFCMCANAYMNSAVNTTRGYSHWEIPEFEALYQAACDETSDIDLRYNKFAEAEAYLLEHAYVVPIYLAGANYRMSSYNEWSRTYSKTGGTEYRYKRIDLYDHALTAAEQDAFHEEWLAAKAASDK